MHRVSLDKNNHTKIHRYNYSLISSADNITSFAPMVHIVEMVPSRRNDFQMVSVSPQLRVLHL